MSTPFLRNTIQSSLLRRNNIFRTSTLQQNIRQFHYSSPKMTVHNINTYVLSFHPHAAHTAVACT